MYRRPVLLLLVFVFSLALSAQNKYTGYILTSNGDSIPGSFQYEQWRNNPATVEFLKATGSGLILTPGNTRAFEIINQDFYLSSEISRLINRMEVYSRYEGIETKVILDSANHYDTLSAFLRRIYYHPAISLFEYTDEKRSNYYYQLPGGPMVELEYKVYLNASGNPVHVRRYHEQLGALFLNQVFLNSDASKKIHRLPYNRGDLTAFFERSMANNRQVIRRYRSDVVFMGGIGLNTMKATPDNINNRASRADINKNITPVIGASYIYYFQRHFGRSFVSPQLKLYSFKHDGIAPYEYFNFLSYAPDTIHAEGKVINLNAFIGRTWIRTPILEWYTSIGPSLFWLVQYKSTEKIGYAPLQTDAGNSFSYFATIQTGIVVRKYLGIWASYSSIPDTNNELPTNLRNQSFQLGMDIRIKPAKKKAVD